MRRFGLTHERCMTVTLPESKLDALVTRHRRSRAELPAGPDRDTYVKLSREFAELQPVVETIKAYRARRRAKSPTSKR